MYLYTIYNYMLKQWRQYFTEKGKANHTAWYFFGAL